MTRIGIPIFTPCFSPRLPTTNDHSSFMLITLPSIKLGRAESGAFLDLVASWFVLRNCVSTSIRVRFRQTARQTPERFLLDRQLLSQLIVLGEQSLSGHCLFRVFNFGF